MNHGCKPGSIWLGVSACLCLLGLLGIAIVKLLT